MIIVSLSLVGHFFATPFSMEGHKVVFYDDGRAISQEVDKDSRKTRPRDVLVKDYYEIDRTVQWIVDNQFERVCNIQPHSYVFSGCPAVS